MDDIHFLFALMMKIFFINGGGGAVSPGLVHLCLVATECGFLIFKTTAGTRGDFCQ